VPADACYTRASKANYPGPRLQPADQLIYACVPATFKPSIFSQVLYDVQRYVLRSSDLDAFMQQFVCLYLSEFRLIILCSLNL
jgi:hypothetical protein